MCILEYLLNYEKFSLVNYQTVHTNSFQVTTFIENKCKIKGYRLKQPNTYALFFSEKVKETENRLLFQTNVLDYTLYYFLSGCTY